VFFLEVSSLKEKAYLRQIRCFKRLMKDFTRNRGADMFPAISATICIVYLYAHAVEREVNRFHVLVPLHLRGNDPHQRTAEQCSKRTHNKQHSAEQIMHSSQHVSKVSKHNASSVHKASASIIYKLIHSSISFFKQLRKY